MTRVPFAMVCALLVSACAVVKVDHNPVPSALVETSYVPGFESARGWADAPSDEFLKTGRLRVEQARRSGIGRSRIEVLALSGGGSNGAFGAGVLAGWTARGNRPEFEIVSGISTGALIAPLAFLGPQYDDDLREFYTTITTDDVLRKAVIGGLIGGGAAVADSAPLAGIIADIVTPDFLAKIAAEHNRGRRLFVTTTNIEAQRPVTWDMGQIANKGTPEALDLFRSVVLASASIPGIFPPVPVKVAAGGRTYTELHVDGGTTTNLFVAPVNVKLPNDRTADIYIVRNGKLGPEFTTIKPTAAAISGQAISTMIKYQNQADVRRVQLLSQRRGFRFQMVSIPRSFDVESSEPFDRDYMNALYDLGYSAGLTGELWTRNPKIF